MTRGAGTRLAAALVRWWVLVLCSGQLPGCWHWLHYLGWCWLSFAPRLRLAPQNRLAVKFRLRGGTGGCSLARVDLGYGLSPRARALSHRALGRRSGLLSGLSSAGWSLLRALHHLNSFNLGSCGSNNSFGSTRFWIKNCLARDILFRFKINCNCSKSSTSKFSGLRPTNGSVFLQKEHL